MVKFSCIICNKGFNRKSNYEYHINDKKRPCMNLENKEDNNITETVPIHTEAVPIHTEAVPIHTETVPIHTEAVPIHTEAVPIHTDNEKVISPTITSFNDMLWNDFNHLININPHKLTDNNTCVFCNTTFVQKASLNRHMKDRCKSKKYYDELEILKEKLNSMSKNYQDLEKEMTNLKNENLKHTGDINTNTMVTNNSNNHNKTVNKNQINNGNILNNTNNTVNVQLVQFGCENIDNIDTEEVMHVYAKSTGGNILSCILKYVNLNDKYPENHNICITDLSRELVKIFNGKKFIIKKFKNAKGDIMSKVIKNTYKIVDKIESDDTLKLTPYIKSKLKINMISLKLIDGITPEEIVRDEIREKEKENPVKKDKKNKKNNKDKKDEKDEKDNDSNNSDNSNDTDNSDDSDDSDDSDASDKSKVERDFSVAEQARIEHLESKQQGLQDISFERLKEELYNGKDLLENKKHLELVK